MGVRLASAFSSTMIANVPASGAETVILTTPTIGLTLDNAAVLIVWYLNQGIGTGTTTASARLRRGTIVSGTLINLGPFLSVTAGANANFNGCYFDTPGIVGQVQYSLTLQGTGTTGAFSNGDGCIIAFVL